ncbi:MAG: AsnC family transcriptional regulator [Sulfuricella sp.]|nr:AsnC family transcriptional regulator [Sulfuricella sp.]
MDDLDRAIINHLQGGFPVCSRPFAEAAAQLGTSEAELIARIDKLLAAKVLSRFGPLYHAERLGGALSLAALKVPPEDFERVTERVNALPEVAHNYARDHALSMWFVLATETPQQQLDAIARIERDTGYPVYNMPKIKEYFIGLRFEA